MFFCCLKFIFILPVDPWVFIHHLLMFLIAFRGPSVARAEEVRLVGEQLRVLLSTQQKRPQHHELFERFSMVFIFALPPPLGLKTALKDPTTTELQKIPPPQCEQKTGKTTRFSFFQKHVSSSCFFSSWRNACFHECGVFFATTWAWWGLSSLLCSFWAGRGSAVGRKWKGQKRGVGQGFFLICLLACLLVCLIDWLITGFCWSDWFCVCWRWW